MLHRLDFWRRNTESHQLFSAMYPVCTAHLFCCISACEQWCVWNYSCGFPWMATTRGLTDDGSLVMIGSNVGWSHVHNPMSNRLCVKMLYSSTWLLKACVCGERDGAVQVQTLCFGVSKVIRCVRFIGGSFYNFIFIAQDIEICLKGLHKLYSIPGDSQTTETVGD